MQIKHGRLKPKIIMVSVYENQTTAFFMRQVPKCSNIESLKDNLWVEILIKC